MELQQPSHHRSRRNRLHSRRSVGARTQAVLRKDLRIPRRHIRLTRFFGINKRHRVQTGELVPFRQFSKEGHRDERQAGRDPGKAQSCHRA